MREVDPFERRPSRAEVRAVPRWPKPDFVRSARSAAELHAYYIALVSAARLFVSADHQLKPR